MGEKDEGRQLEIDEMAAMQVELMSQLKSSGDEVERRTLTISELQAELSTKDGKIEVLGQNLSSATTSLKEALVENKQCKSKLSSVVPKLDSADAELRLLRARMRELESVDSENGRLTSEIGAIRPVKDALDAITADLRNFSVGGGENIAGSCGTTRTEWHQQWCSSANLAALLPSLSDRIQSLLSDLSICESESGRLEQLLTGERAERATERSVLSDSLVAKEHECKEMSKRLVDLTREEEELRVQVQKARDASAALSHLRTVWISHCEAQEEEMGGKLGDMEVIHLVGKALFAGRQAQARDASSVQRIVEIEAMLKMKELEMSKLSRENKENLMQLNDQRASADSDIAALRSEGVGLAAELESAADLAEKQGALAVTLEGRLDALSAERAMLSAQFHASQNEIEQYRSSLSSALSRAKANVPDAIWSGGSTSKLSGVEAGLQSAAAVVDGVCEALDLLSDRVPQLSQELVEAKARLEMSDVVRQARETARTPVGDARQHSQAGESFAGTPLSSSVAAVAHQQNYLGNQFKRSAVDSARDIKLMPKVDQQQIHLNVSGFAKTPQSTLEMSRDVPRAPSPGTVVLQERLRRAQAAFAQLTA